MKYNNKNIQELNRKVCSLKKIESFMFITSAYFYNGNISCNCLVQVIEENETYFANATYCIDEIKVYDITVDEYLKYQLLKEGQQLSLF